MNEALPQPLLIWDGDCSFCRRWITRWKYLTDGRIDYEPSQTAAERFPQIPKEQFGKSVFLVEPDGRITRAAEAVFRSLALGGQVRYLLWLYVNVAPFAAMTEALYGFVARHRDGVDRIDKIVVGRETRPATYLLTRALFLRAIGAVYLIAFASLFTQIDGLIGSNGILPASHFADYAMQFLGRSRWWQAPSLIYFSSSDHFLHGLCITGIAASIALIVGIAPMFMTIILWVCYLSLVTAGQIFLGYQWDYLLLEAGFLAILFSPPWWVGQKIRPSRVVLFLIRWLLFRLMFLSALVKWCSGDACWRDMSALRYHFETQPIPTWTSWYAHNSPQWILAVACFCMFFIEGIVPFLYFAPRRTRMLAFWLTVLLQVSIIATGNYGFFNLLTIALAFSLLDDVAISKWLCLLAVPLKWHCRLVELRELPKQRPLLRLFVVYPAAIVIFIVGAIEGIERTTERAFPEPLATLERYVAPFGSSNSYGLFAVMTKERPELIVEGSDDGITWKEYQFKWKAGDVNRWPMYCAPHMPRLDWQMWFAALDPDRVRPWVQNFVFRLLTGQREVLDLMAANPFPDRPPIYIRIDVYDYHFTTRAERAANGAWWKRTPRGIYLPPATLRQQIKPADEDLKL